MLDNKDAMEMFQLETGLRSVRERKYNIGCLPSSPNRTKMISRLEDEEMMLLEKLEPLYRRIEDHKHKE